MTSAPTVTNQQINSIVVKDEFDPDFIYYLMKIVGRELNFISKTSTAVPIINKSTFSNTEVFVPSLENQIRIGRILSSLDEKIENNRRINDNLEQQAQALYNEWFVENPKSDWHSVNLSEIATFVSGYSYKGNELVENSDTAMATIKNFERNGGFKIDGYKPIIPSPKLKVDQRAQLFDILVAHTDLTQNAEVIGNAEMLLSKDIYKDLIFSMDLVKVNAKESFPFQFLLALLLKNHRFKSHCIGYVNGTTVLHMNKRALPDYETIIPNLEDAQNLNATAKAIFCQMSENLTEISNLTEMRDTLLPRLMSGELKINDLDS
jgi:type I restriction enzyme S subunit